MSTTTPSAIRTLIAARITGLTPAIESGTKFRQHEEREDFRAWAAANPAGALRRFSVRQAPLLTGPDVSDGRTEAVVQEFEILVAYPADGRFGSRHVTDLDNVIERDRTQIACTTGTNGVSYTDATVIETTEESEDLGPTRLGVVRLTIRYFRDARPS